MTWLHALWFHYEWPSDVGNGPEDITSLGIVGIVGTLVWPRTRHAIERFVQRHLRNEHAELHRKLDAIIKHHGIQTDGGDTDGEILGEGPKD